MKISDVTVISTFSLVIVIAKQVNSEYALHFNDTQHFPVRHTGEQMKSEDVGNYRLPLVVLN